MNNIVFQPFSVTAGEGFFNSEKPAAHSRPALLSPREGAKAAYLYRLHTWYVPAAPLVSNKPGTTLGTGRFTRYKLMKKSPFKKPPPNIFSGGVIPDENRQIKLPPMQHRPYFQAAVCRPAVFPKVIRYHNRAH